jgi:cytochrome c-type biogenesis protein CcmH
MLFLLLAGCLILVALLFVLPPLWRQRPMIAADMDERNTEIARQRLAELKQQLQTGALSQAHYAEQRAELEQALSDDLDITAPVRVSASTGRWMAIVLMVLIPLLAGVLYADLGTYQAIEPSAEMLATAPTVPNIEEIKKMVDKLAERMKTKPDDALGWTMLGKSYKYLQRYPEAVAAFAKAYALLGDQPEIMLLYADALAYANNEQLAGQAADLVFKALALEPENLTGLWLGGMAKAQAGEAAEAIKLWRKLDGLLVRGSPEQKEVQSLLAKLASQLPANTAEQPALQQPQAADVAINIQVSLAPELQKSVNAGDTVFVYAQALSGVKMPLAIVRKQVTDLPLTVTLTDAMAMMPTMKLSNFTQVKLLARVSKSGNAMSQSGDLIGVIDSAALTDKSSHQLIIRDVVK